MVTIANHFSRFIESAPECAAGKSPSKNQEKNFQQQNVLLNFEQRPFFQVEEDSKLFGGIGKTFRQPATWRQSYEQFTSL